MRGGGETARRRLEVRSQRAEIKISKFEIKKRPMAPSSLTFHDLNDFNDFCGLHHLNN